MATFTARRFGRDVGWLAGLIQATSFWFVVRGRLAEADIILACLITWTMVAFDRLRTQSSRTQDSGLGTRDSGAGIRKPHLALGRSASPLLPGEGSGVRVVNSFPRSAWECRPRRSASVSPSAAPLGTRSVQDGIPTQSVGTSEERTVPAFRVDPALTPFQAPAFWRWAFFAGLGATALVKGLGFGAVLVGSAVATTLIWDRDRSAIRALLNPKGWALAGVLALTWPVLVAIRLPSAVSLWTLARHGPAGEPPRALHRRPLVAVWPGGPGAGAALDAAGPGGGLALAAQGDPRAGSRRG